LPINFPGELFPLPGPMTARSLSNSSICS
jgi:hypothetical protein